MTFRTITSTRSNWAGCEAEVFWPRITQSVQSAAKNRVP
jgi:hypothetical protein